jgi:hypothetical protein
MYEVNKIDRMTEQYEIVMIRLIMRHIYIKAVSFDPVLELTELHRQLKSHQTIVFFI